MLNHKTRAKSRKKESKSGKKEIGKERKEGKIKKGTKKCVSFFFLSFLYCSIWVLKFSSFPLFFSGFWFSPQLMYIFLNQLIACSIVVQSSADRAF